MKWRWYRDHRLYDVTSPGVYIFSRRCVPVWGWVGAGWRGALARPPTRSAVRGNVARARASAPYWTARAASSCAVAPRSVTTTTRTAAAAAAPDEDAADAGGCVDDRMWWDARSHCQSRTRRPWRHTWRHSSSLWRQTALTPDRRLRHTCTVSAKSPIVVTRASDIRF